MSDKTFFQQALDQILHATAGLLLVVVFAFFLPLPAAIGISVMAGVVREIYQRYDINLHWYECGAGCRLDLVFWILGTGIGSVTMFVFRG